jgi:hypothetical protein
MYRCGWMFTISSLKDVLREEKLHLLDDLVVKLNQVRNCITVAVLALTHDNIKVNLNCTFESELNKLLTVVTMRQPSPLL